jgi:hypothetical protein
MKPANIVLEGSCLIKKRRIKKKENKISLSSLFVSFYEYGIVGTTLRKADVTSFRSLPELVNTSIT